MNDSIPLHFLKHCFIVLCDSLINVAFFFLSFIRSEIENKYEDNSHILQNLNKFYKQIALF